MAFLLEFVYMKKSLLLLVPLVFLTGCFPFVHRNTNSSSSSQIIDDTPITFDKFHTLATRASLEENGYKAVVVNGKLKNVDANGNITTYKFDNFQFHGFTNGRLSSSEMTSQFINYINNENMLIAFSLVNSSAEKVGESENTKYYANPFRIVSVDKNTKLVIGVAFNSYGLPVDFSTFTDKETTSVRIKWIK